MSGGDEYRDASRRPLPVSLPGGPRSESSVESASVRARIKFGSSAMATTTTTTTTRCAVNTCEKEPLSSADERTTASSSSLRNGLTFRGTEEAGRINGYTLSNGHVHVSSRCSRQPPLVLATRGFHLVSPDPMYVILFLFSHDS